MSRIVFNYHCVISSSNCISLFLRMSFIKTMLWILFVLTDYKITKGKGKWSRSVMSDSLRPHGLSPIRLLRPWDSPGKNTGVGCHFLHQIFPTQELNLGLPHCTQTPYHLSHQTKHYIKHQQYCPILLMWGKASNRRPSCNLKIKCLCCFCSVSSCTERVA